MNQQPTLQGERLLLRPFELSDAARVQALAGQRAIAEMTLEIPYPYENGMAEQWISSHRPKFEEGKLAVFAITLHATGEVVGAIGLTIAARFERAELGYWVGTPYWNKGYCTEAGRAVLSYGFKARGLHRIFATHFSRNSASGRVMQKLGMKHEGHLRQHVRKWDRFEDMDLYGILQAEWEWMRPPQA